MDSKSKKKITASVLIIGNEILSGRTLDKNTQYIAQKLGERGIRLMETRTITDNKQIIADTVNELRQKYSYVFTTGGIGPTHDDITAESVAHAFGVSYERNEEGYLSLVSHYGEENLTDARIKMSMMPAGVKLIPNPVSGAAGFHIGNVFVMAGVPNIMQAMMDYVIARLEGGEVIHSVTIMCDLPESKLADELRELQYKNPTVDIGSYPRYASGTFGLSVVLRSENKSLIENLAQSIKQKIENMGVEASVLKE